MRAIYQINLREFVNLVNKTTLKSLKYQSMLFEKGFIYHVYNQGNNRQNIFYNRENYIYFLQKLKKYILPYADILAWCLMPNHFHLMILVNEIELNEKELIHQMTKTRLVSHQMANNRCGDSHQMTNTECEDIHQMNVKKRSINTSISIMLRSYTRAINKQEKRTGSLFKSHTKAECINCFKAIKPCFIQSNLLINNHLSKKQYLQVCFNYIHQNPVKAKLVKNVVDWEFSSAKDYACLRNGKLINKKVTEEYVDF